MPKRTNPADEEMARLALTLTDLRAHFEAQLRTIIHAERSLRQCQSAADAAAFATAVKALRKDVQLVSDNNRTAKTVLDQAHIHVRAMQSGRVEARRE